MKISLNALLVLLASIVCLTRTYAQQPKNLPRIAFFCAATAQTNVARMKAFHSAMTEMGYSEGKHYVFKARCAENDPKRLKAYAAELAADAADIIITGGATATKPIKAATSTIPIIMTNDNDPVASGFVKSLARPGGNVTGLSTLSPEISGKQLSLLKEIIPKISRVAVLWNSKTPGHRQMIEESEKAASVTGLTIQPVETPTANDIESAFEKAKQARSEGILVLQNVAVFTERARVVKEAAKLRIPSILPSVEYVEAGGMISYGVSVTDLYRRAAYYVDRILKGSKPAELPVEQPTKFEFAINLKTAKQIGVTIPPNVLARADRIIR